jgi:hypothetical protein
MLAGNGKLDVVESEFVFFSLSEIERVVGVA